MPPVNAPLFTSILAIIYFVYFVFAISAALTAARYRMDVLGFVLIGSISGTGGGHRFLYLHGAAGRVYPNWQSRR